MKNPIQRFIVLLVLLVGFFSCQHEENELQESPETLSKSSDLTSLLKRVATPEADNNTIDSATCFKIKLPVSLNINGTGLIVADESGYQQAADILNESYSNTDYITYTFPLTVIYDDGHEVDVPDRNALWNIQLECPLQAQNVDPIGCISLHFPIAISGYDSQNQLQSTQTIYYLSDMLGFLLGLDGTTYYSINYPISITNASGSTIVIANNSELTQAIQSAENTCSCSNPRILTDNLTLYIPFAGEVKDLTGFSTPTIVGNHHYVTDRSGNPNGAISFDQQANGATDGVSITNQLAGGNLNQNNAFTLSFWYNRQNSNIGLATEQLVNSIYVIANLGDIGNPTGTMEPWIYSVGINSVFFDPSWNGQNLGAETGVWHHLVVTYDGSQNQMTLYRDGILRATTFTNTQMPQNIFGMSLGSSFKGYMDDVRGYKRALNEYEINVLYHLDGDVNTCLFRQ